MPERLVAHARLRGYDTIALTDHGGLYGVVRAHAEARAQGIRLIVGARIQVGDEAPRIPIVLHVETSRGYENLCKLLTIAHARRPRGSKLRDPSRPEHELEPHVPLSIVAAHAEGLWALVLPRSLHDVGVERAFDTSALGILKTAFDDRLSVACMRHRTSRDREMLTEALSLTRRFDIALCATNQVLFTEPYEKMIADVLACIRRRRTLDDAGRFLLENAEAHLKSPSAIVRLFSDRPEAVERTLEIADACRFSLGELRYRFPSEIDDPAHPLETPDQALRRLTIEGARVRYPDGAPRSVIAQIEKELTLIEKLEVAPYFLSVRQIVDMARVRDILCQGRGSAANSAVCFCLGITAVDPARSNLLFERFMSAERREPPDIDVDFEHERREEIIQAIYERYGRDRAAMVSEIICFRLKSAIRDVAKVFGLSPDQIESLSKCVGYGERASDLGAEHFERAGLDPDDGRLKWVVECAARIDGLPRHLSIHVGGFVLSAEPLARVAPIEPAQMPDRTIIPWDKDDLDALGFFKVDVLGLGMLTAIRKALTLASENDERLRADSSIERLARVPAEDPDVYDALCRADTVGVFQIESRAQMAMLPRLRPRNFYDLVVEVAIVRPGPIQGGMVHPYLRRRSGEEPIESPHPCLEPIVSRTLGVPIFQEQVMQIAIVGAGYSGGEADQLRRDMAAWRRNGRLERHRERLARGFAERGVSQAFSERLYEQIKGFGEYGFPESHAASFALLVYASAWLKVHHPAAFACGLINSQPLGFYSNNTILQDAQRERPTLRSGKPAPRVRVLPVRIDVSRWESVLEEDDAGLLIRLGMHVIKGMRERAARRIELARGRSMFSSIEDLAGRARLDKRELGMLAESGALEPLAPGRRQALYRVRAPREAGLFDGQALDEHRPKLLPMRREEQLCLDYERTGISIADHPMRAIRHRLSLTIQSSRALKGAPNGARVKTAGLVICRQRPATASGVVFMTLEDELGFVNLVLWQRVFERFRHVATSSPMLEIDGIVQRTPHSSPGDGIEVVVHVVVERIRRLEAHRQRTHPRSRDFH